MDDGCTRSAVLNFQHFAMLSKLSRIDANERKNGRQFKRDGIATLCIARCFNATTQHANYFTVSCNWCESLKGWKNRGFITKPTQALPSIRLKASSLCHSWISARWWKYIKFVYIAKPTCHRSIKFFVLSQGCRKDDPIFPLSLLFVFKSET